MDKRNRGVLSHRGASHVCVGRMGADERTPHRAVKDAQGAVLPGATVTITSPRAAA